MTQFFYETRGREKINGLRKEGMMSQAVHRSEAPKAGFLQGVPKFYLVIIGILGLLLISGR